MLNWINVRIILWSLILAGVAGLGWFAWYEHNTILDLRTSITQAQDAQKQASEAAKSCSDGVALLQAQNAAVTAKAASAVEQAKKNSAVLVTRSDSVLQRSSTGDSCRDANDLLNEVIQNGGR